MENLANEQHRTKTEPEKGNDMTEVAKSVLVITPHAELSEAIDTALKDVPGFKLRQRVESLAKMNGHATTLAAEMDVIIFETSDDESADIQAVRALAKARRSGGQLVAMANEDITLSRIRALNDAGVDDVLPKTLTRDEITSRMRQLQQKAGASGAEQAAGRLIAVAQARGGVGATTVAVNLADELSSRPGGLLHKGATRKVALVDLDLQFGSVGAFLDLGEQDALQKLAFEGELPDDAFVTESLVALPQDLDVLAAPSTFLPLDALRPEQIAAIISKLRSSHDYVVVDLPHVLVDWIEPVIKAADELLIVTDTTVPAIRNCRRLIDFFSSDSPDLKIRIVVNHEKKKSLFGSGVQKEAAKALEQKLEHWLPDEPNAARASADRGKPLSAVASRSDLSKAMKHLAKAILAEPPIPAETVRRAK